MFLGEFNHTLDPKNRVIVPAKFRNELGDSFVLTAGLDGCLYIYTYQGFEKVAEQLMSMDSNKDTRAVQRHFMQNAAECEIDSQGRTVIPANLKKLAGIEKDVMFIGNVNKIEVWSTAKLEGTNDNESVEDKIDRVAEKYSLKF